MEVIALGFLMLIGSTFIVMSWSDFKKQIRCKNWVRVDAKIAHIGVSRVQNLDGRPRFTPWIEYEYRIQGTWIRSGQISLSNPTNFNQDDEKEFREKFKVNTPVDAWHNPNDIHESVLKRGMTLEAIAPIFWGIALISFALFKLIF
jgi:hypothetical protein